MTTSSSERGRCTRISPSAILDDRLEGNDLEWALDHLKTCDVCRDRIEEFREIAVRVERLPLASIAPAVVRDAYTWAIPEGQRTDPEASLARAGIAPGETQLRPEPTRIDLPQWDMPIEDELPPPAPSRAPMREEAPPTIPSHAVTRDEAPPPIPSRPVMRDEAPPSPPPPPLLPMEAALAPTVHEVDFDSRRPAPAFVPEDQPSEAAPPMTPDSRREARVATMMRVAVGLVAAACVLLAGLLYADGGVLFRSRPASSHSPSASVRSSPASSARPTVRPSPSVAASITPIAPAASAAPIATLGDGVAGAQVFQIRVGTADPRFTRLVFDMTAQGLPTMIITQPDASHLVVTFKDTTGAGVATGGVHTARVAGIEPASQQGNDLVFTIDLARPVQVKASTLPPPPRYRLVLDLY